MGDTFRFQCRDQQVRGFDGWFHLIAPRVREKLGSAGATYNQAGA
jgi:hypothetical protein